MKNPEVLWTHPEPFLLDSLQHFTIFWDTLTYHNLISQALLHTINRPVPLVGIKTPSLNSHTYWNRSNPILPLRIQRVVPSEVDTRTNLEAAVSMIIRPLVSTELLFRTIIEAFPSLSIVNTLNSFSSSNNGYHSHDYPILQTVSKHAQS